MSWLPSGPDRIDDDRRWQCPDIRHQRIAIGLGQVKSSRLRERGQRRGRLRMPRYLKAQLVSTRTANKLVQTRKLSLPAKPADPALFGTADSSLDVGGLTCGHRHQDLRRDIVNSARAEQRGGVAFGETEIEPVRRRQVA